MKARSVALAAAQAAETTSLCWCIRLQAKNGTVFGRTSTDVGFDFNGDSYDAIDGVRPSQIEQSADLSVKNLDLVGFLTALGVNEADVRGGIWDGAAVTVFEVDYSDLSAGAMILQFGSLGNISTSRLTYSAEFRSLAQVLQQKVGDVFTANCRANLGDDRCKVDLDPLTVTGAITSVASRSQFTDTARVEVTDYFGAGVITWTSGLNAGFSMEVGFFDSASFTLCLPMPFNVQVGDTYSLVPGCRKRVIEDCKTKFNNILNFRAFPYVPGNKKTLGLGGTEGSNL